MISRRQFLRACMYAAPAAIVAPKAIRYFLPPRIDVATPEEINLVAWGPDVHADSDIIELIQRRMNEAMNRMVDEMAMNIYNTAPTINYMGGLSARPLRARSIGRTRGFGPRNAGSTPVP